MVGLQNVIDLLLPAAPMELNRARTGHIVLPSVDFEFGHLYGGQVFSQSIIAAQSWLQLVNAQLQIHACHGLFLNAGNPIDPILFEVNPLGRGQTFQRLEVLAIQAEKLVFKCFLSAQLPEKAYIQHSAVMPKAAMAQDCITDYELKSKLLGTQCTQKLRPIDVRVATPEAFTKARDVQHKQGLWLRFRDAADVQPVSKLQRQALLAYASDYGFLGALFMPHAPELKIAPYFLTSLDHALWYYEDFDPCKWVYFESETPVADHGRGVVTGRFFQNSKLIAIAVQEGLLRRRE